MRIIEAVGYVIIISLVHGLVCRNEILKAGYKYVALS